MTITTPEQAQQQALIAQLEVMREQMARELELAQAARLEAERRLNEGVPVGADSIEFAIAEFAKDKTGHVQGGAMQAPCAHVSPEGVPCGQPWRDHLPAGTENLNRDGGYVRISGHKYRQKPLVTSDKPKGNGYHLTAADLAKYGLDKPEEQPIEALYIDEPTAATLLGATVAQVRKMIKSESIKADRIGKVTLVHRISVDRIVAMRELAQGGDDA